MKPDSSRRWTGQKIICAKGGGTIWVAVEELLPERQGNNDAERL